MFVHSGVIEGEISYVVTGKNKSDVNLEFVKIKTGMKTGKEHISFEQALKEIEDMENFILLVKFKYEF